MKNDKLELRFAALTTGMMGWRPSGK